jgi:hypothetical protein
MARPIAIVLLTGGMLAPAGTQLAAEELAASSQLPAALHALGISRGDVVTTAQAGQVRGQFYVSEGVIVQFAGTAAYPRSAMAIVGTMGGREVTFSAQPDGIRISTSKIAYVSGEPRIQGVLATQTGVYNGVMQFVGGPESLDIIAVPGAFLANFE